MINFFTILTAFTAQLNASVDVIDIAKASQGEYINTDMNRAPWVGVYRGKVRYEPRTLGHNNWEAIPMVKVVAQASSTTDPTVCEERLEDLVEKIIAAITADNTISNTVEMLNSIDVEYGFIETGRDSLYFQSAIITFELEVATQ